MISNYLIYLYTLSKEEQIKQIMILLIFILVSFVICIMIDFLKSKFFNKHKDKLFFYK